MARSNSGVLLAGADSRGIDGRTDAAFRAPDEQKHFHRAYRSLFSRSVRGMPLRMTCSPSNYQITAFTAMDRPSKATALVFRLARVSASVETRHQNDQVTGLAHAFTPSQKNLP
jgi:hypothetical protein